MKIDKYKDDIYTCNHCGFCREMVDYTTETYRICPFYDVFGFESYTGRGKINIAMSLLEGKLKYTPQLAERLYSCLLCGNCKEHCEPLTIDIPEITKAMREDLVQEGLELDSLKQLDSIVSSTHNIFNQDASKRSNWATDLKLSDKGETLYFAGCYAAYQYPKTAKATINILKEAGINLAYLGNDEWCCGTTCLADGSTSIAEEVARHNVKAIKNSGAKRVITSCAGCYHTLKSEYPKIVGELPFEIVHISDVIADLLDKGEIKLSNSFKKRVTYHDPCHLGRYEDIYDSPRNVLGSIPDIQLLEMQRNRRNAWCCGGGTITYAAFTDTAQKIASTRVSEAKNIDAETIVTTCPLCVTLLNQAAKREGIDVYDLPVIVAKSMGLTI